MSAFRCNYCEIKWPRAEEFSPCPQCREPVIGITTSPDLDVEEAWARKQEWDFSWWLLGTWLS